MKDFFVVYEGSDYKNARKVSNLTALSALHLPFLPQKSAAQVECQQPLVQFFFFQPVGHELGQLRVVFFAHQEMRVACDAAFRQVDEFGFAAIIRLGGR